MTSLLFWSKRSEGYDTYGYVPVRSSVVQDHVIVVGDTMKVLRLVSLLDRARQTLPAKAVYGS